MDVVIDAPTDADDLWIGRASTQAPDVDNVTLVRGVGLRVGQFIDAKVTGTDGYDLVAEVR